MTTAPPEGQQLEQKKRKFNRPLFAAYAVASLAAVFYVPYFVPVAPSVSDSYLFGYNNRAGVVLLIVLVAIGVVWTRGMQLEFPPDGNSRPVSTKVLLVALAAVLLGCVGMWMFAGRCGGFLESAYFIDRTWLLSQGKIPYVDFEYCYGVGLLYGPLFLGRLLGIGLVQGYYVFWAFNFVLGAFLLFKIVNLIEYPASSKRSIFLLLFLFGLPAILTMGSNYTYLRFLLPIYFVLVVQQFHRRGNRRARVTAAIAAVAFTATLLLISAETAIAHAFACVCIFVFAEKRRDRASRAITTGLLLVLAALFWSALKLHLLDTIRDAGAGANSFPVTFAPYILLFVAALFVCGCYVYLRFAERKMEDHLLGVIAFSVPMVAAALGRCDPGHVYWNGQGLFLASMFYVSNRKRLWKSCRTAFVVFFLLLPNLGGLIFLGPFIKSAIRHNALARVGEDSSSKVDLSRIYPSWHGTFFAPFGYKPNGLGSYLSNQVDYGRYEAFLNENTPAAIHETVAEMEDNPEKALLLPDNLDTWCRVRPRAERIMLGIILSFPYFGKAVHTESLRQPVCDYIHAHYRLEVPPGPNDFEYGLWIRKTGDL